MAWKRTKVGEVIKGKIINEETGERKPDYVKVANDVTLTRGDYLNLESKEDQITSVNNAIANGKLDSTKGGEILERIEKIPEFVRFEIVSVKRVD